MPMAEVNGVDINYELEGDGPETIVLINGLADDLTTWFGQVPDFLAAGYRVLRFDNRGIGKSARPKGPYTTALMAKRREGAGRHAEDRQIPPRRRLDGRHDLAGICARLWRRSEVPVAVLHLCRPGPFCSRMFRLWQDMAPVMGVPTVMRDVTLWAFTQDFFLNQEPTLKEFEAAMAALDQPVEAYLSQLHAIQVHDTRSRLKSIKVPTLVLAGADDILIPMNLSKELHSLIPGAEFATAKGGHAFLWEFPAPFNEAVLKFVGKHRKTSK